MTSTLLKAEPNLPVVNRWRRRRAVAMIIVGIFAMAAELWATVLSPVVGVALIGAIAYLECMLSWLAFIAYGRTRVSRIGLFVMKLIRRVPAGLGLGVGGTVIALTAGSMTHEALMISGCVLLVSTTAATLAGMAR